MADGLLMLHEAVEMLKVPAFRVCGQWLLGQADLD